MPNKDGTGPEGKGPQTGRQRGNCKSANPDVREGRGFGPCGQGLGWGRGFRRQLSKENQDA